MCECEYCTYCQLWLSDLIITQTQRLYSVEAAGSTRGVLTNISLLICILLTPPLLPATAAKWVINKFSPLHIWSQRKSLQTHNTASNQESYRVRNRKPSSILDPRKIKGRKHRRWKTTDTFILFCCYWKQKTGSHRKFWELWAQMPLKHTQFQAPGLIWELKSSNLWWQ